MVQYGSINYWNERYEKEEDNPFDWLVDYSDVEEILLQILPDDKSKLILLPGCGNALFSPELCFKGGYINQLNFDVSSVVIEQMIKKYGNYDPNQPSNDSNDIKLQWKVMDVLDLDIPTESVPTIIDKSLIDTLLCYQDGQVNATRMIRELYRVLSPGGRYITFSLHAVDEIRPYFDHTIRQVTHDETNNSDSSLCDWHVRYYRIKSSRWNPGKNRKRAVSCTMIVCYKSGADNDPVDIRGTLSDSEYQELSACASKINMNAALKNITIEEMMKCLDRALELHDLFLVAAKQDLMTNDMISKLSHSPSSIRSQETIVVEHEETNAFKE